MFPPRDLMKAAGSTSRAVEPLRRRLIRSLLYGRNVDRAAKARARVENRVNTTESRFAAGLNRLLQQNLPISDITIRPLGRQGS
jgi:hypothetical protein